MGLSVHVSCWFTLPFYFDILSFILIVCVFRSHTKSICLNVIALITKYQTKWHLQAKDARAFLRANFTFLSHFLLLTTSSQCTIYRYHIGYWPIILWYLLILNISCSFPDFFHLDYFCLHLMFTQS